MPDKIEALEEVIVDSNTVKNEEESDSEDRLLKSGMYCINYSFLKKNIFHNRSTKHAAFCELQ